MTTPAASTSPPEWLDVDQYTTPSVRVALRDALDAVEILARDTRRVARRVLRARLAYEAQALDTLADTIGIREQLEQAVGLDELAQTLHEIGTDLRSMTSTAPPGVTPLWWVEEALKYRESVPQVEKHFDSVRERVADTRTIRALTEKEAASVREFESILEGKARRDPDPPEPACGPGRPTIVWAVFDDLEREIVRRHLQMMRLRNLRPLHIQARLGTLSRLRHHLDVNLLDATGDQLGAWLEYRATHVSADTRGVDLSHVRQFYGWALNEMLVPVDPTLRLIRPRRARRLPRPMPDDKLALALSEATGDVAVILHLACFAGLRAHEIAGLDREDVRHTAHPPVLNVRDGKGGKARVVPLAPDLVTILCRVDLPKSGPLIRGRKSGDRVSRSTICHYANQYLHDLGIDETLHTCRHWFGTRVYAMTSDLRLTQELMGHSSPNTTAGYAAWSPERGHDAVSRFTGPGPT